jgi:hypothetical protein
MAKGQKPDYKVKLPVEGVWHRLGAAWKSKEGDTIDLVLDVGVFCHSVFLRNVSCPICVIGGKD